MASVSDCNVHKMELTYTCYIICIFVEIQNIYFYSIQNYLESPPKMHEMAISKAPRTELLMNWKRSCVQYTRVIVVYMKSLDLLTISYNYSE